MKIALKEKEYSKLRQLSPSFTCLMDVLDASIKQRSMYYVDINEELAGKLHDICGEELQKVGFDENYEPTEDGVLLEALIDKLYVE